jgi:hypothetical protein
MKIFKRPYRIGTQEFIEVNKLPSENVKINKKVEKLQKAISEGEQAKIMLDNLQKSCSHEYFYDEEGYPYHYRYCATCKGYMGTI